VSQPDSSETRSRRQLSLRQLLLAGVSATVLYVGALGLWLAFVVRPQTDRLPREGTSALRTFRDITTRATRLSETITQLDELTTMPRDTAAIALAQEQLQPGRGLLTPLDVDGVSPAVRGMLARVDDEATLLQDLLIEVLAEVQLQRTTDARTRLSTARGIHAALQRNMSEVQRLAVEDLQEREHAVASIVRTSTLIAATWCVIGTLLLLLWAWLLLRRLERPVRALERGLARISDGNYNHDVPVEGEDELGRVARLFNEARRVLRVRARQEGRFAAAGQLLADVAHEVNNPLMAISGLVEARLDDGLESAEARADFLAIQRQTARASKLMSGLLRFVRTTEDEPQPVDLVRATRSAADLVSYQFGVREITLVDRLEHGIPQATIDPGRFEQVLVNLLSNAVDALRDAPHPRTLMLESTVQGDEVEIAIVDSGPGIPDAIRARLFQPFATSKGTKGNGLGLYISRQLLRDAGGDLRYDPRPAEGARFVVSLPAIAAATTSVGPDPLPLPTPAAVSLLAVTRILLVDDEEPVRSVVARFLRRRGAEVVEAADGVEGLEQIALGRVDGVITDLRMPRMDGAQFHAALLQREPTLAARLVMLSGDVMLFGDGADVVPAERVLLKPVEFKRLEAALVAAMRLDPRAVERAA
jgi:signal transduction histidine kinase/ActR/RegA family two-component response regulator